MSMLAASGLMALAVLVLLVVQVRMNFKVTGTKKGWGSLRSDSTSIPAAAVIDAAGSSVSASDGASDQRHRAGRQPVWDGRRL